MTYVLRFLPVVEADALTGYTWYEEKAEGSGKNSCACSMPAPGRFHAIHCCTPRFIGSFGAAYSGDFHMPFTFG